MSIINDLVAEMRIRALELEDKLDHGLTYGAYFYKVGTPFCEQPHEPVIMIFMHWMLDDIHDEQGMRGVVNELAQWPERYESLLPNIARIEKIVDLRLKRERSRMYGYHNGEQVLIKWNDPDLVNEEEFAIIASVDDRLVQLQNGMIVEIGEYSRARIVKLEKR
jgi:hypothetical protein